jgi:hypothetical protein
MDLKTIKVRTLGKECDAVKVTAYNAFDVAKWCGGTLTKMHIQPGEPVAVEIEVPLAYGTALAVLHDYVVKSAWGTFSVYPPSVFHQTFSHVLRFGEKTKTKTETKTETMAPECMEEPAPEQRTNVLLRLGIILSAWAKGESAKQGDLLALPLSWRPIVSAVDARIVSGATEASPQPSPAMTEAREDSVFASSVNSVVVDARRWRYVRERLCIVRERETQRFGAPSQVLTKVRLRFPYMSLPYELHETHTAEELDREIDKAIILDAGR